MVMKSADDFLNNTEEKSTSFFGNLFSSKKKEVSADDFLERKSADDFLDGKTQEPSLFDRAKKAALSLKSSFQGYPKTVNQPGTEGMPPLEETGFEEKPNLLSKLGIPSTGNVPKDLFNFARTPPDITGLAKMALRTGSKAIGAGEDIGYIKSAYPKSMAIGEGITNSLSGLLAPENVAIAAASQGVGPLYQRALSGMFTYLMGREYLPSKYVPGVKETMFDRVYNSEPGYDRTKELTSALVTAPFVGLAGTHASGARAPLIPNRRMINPEEARYYTGETLKEGIIPPERQLPAPNQIGLPKSIELPYQSPMEALKQPVPETPSGVNYFRPQNDVVSQIEALTGKTFRRFEQDMRENKIKAEMPTQQKAETFIPTFEELKTMQQEVGSADAYKHGGKLGTISNLPEYYKRIGIGRNEFMPALEKAIRGEPLTERQTQFLSDVTEQFRNQKRIKSDYEAFSEANRKAKTAPKEDISFNFGENAKTEWPSNAGAVLNPAGAMIDLVKMARNSKNLAEFRKSVAENQDILDTVRFYKMNIDNIYSNPDKFDHTPKTKTMIEQNGATYIGVQEVEKGKTPFALFNEKTTGSTLALPIDKLTPENIKAKLQETQKKIWKPTLSSKQIKLIKESPSRIKFEDLDKDMIDFYSGKETKFYEPIPEGNEITIYRATPNDSIRPGDFVTQSKKYAEEHLKTYLKGKGKIISEKVKKEDLELLAPNEFRLLTEEKLAPKAWPSEAGASLLPVEAARLIIKLAREAKSYAEFRESVSKNTDLQDTVKQMGTNLRIVYDNRDKDLAKSTEEPTGINISKFPEDVRLNVQDIVMGPDFDKTKRISNEELMARAAELKGTPTIDHIAKMPEIDLPAEALRLRQGNTELIRKALKLDLGDLKTTLDTIIKTGMEKQRKISSTFGRGLQQQKLPAEAQNEMANLIQERLKAIKKDPVFKNDKGLIESIENLQKTVVSKEFNPTMWNKAYYIWMNSLLSNPLTHLANVSGNMLFALSKIPEKFAAATFDIPLSKITGKRTQFYGEIPAMVKGAFGKEKPDVMPGHKLDTYARPIEGNAGKVIGFPTDMLKVEDDIAKTVIGKMELASQKFKGKTGEALTQAVHDEQLYRTFQNDPGVIADTMMYARNKIPGFRYVIPFLRTPANLIKAGLERTPFVLAKILYKGGKKSYTQETLANDLGLLGLGSTLAGWIAIQHKKGNITGDVPRDAAERDAFYRQGKKPNSFKLGGMWIPVERMEPLGSSFSIIANLIQDYEKSEQPIPADKVLDAVGGLANTLTNKTYLSGMTSLIQMTSDPERYGTSYMKRTAGSIIPGAVKFFQDMSDNYYREANTTLEFMKSKIPGVSQTMPPKLNAFGEPVRKERFIGKANDSSIESALKETPIRFPSKILAGQKLSPQEYRELLMNTGPTTKKYLERIGPERLQRIPVDEREKIVESLQREIQGPYQDILRMKIKARNPMEALRR
jgi:hypothetical protein